MSDSLQDGAIDRVARALTEGEPDGGFRARVTARIGGSRRRPSLRGGVFDPLVLVGAVGILAAVAIPSTLRVSPAPLPDVSMATIAAELVAVAAQPLQPPIDETIAGEAFTLSTSAWTRPAGRIAGVAALSKAPMTMPYELPGEFGSLVIDPMPSPDAIAVDDLTIAPLDTY